MSNLATDKDKVLVVAVVTSAYYQAPVVIDQYVASADGPERERQTLEAEAGNAWSQDCEQVVSGPLCVSRGGGAGPDEVAR